MVYLCFVEFWTHSHSICWLCDRQCWQLTWNCRFLLVFHICLCLSIAATPYETQNDFSTNISWWYLRMWKVLGVSESFCPPLCDQSYYTLYQYNQWCQPHTLLKEWLLPSLQPDTRGWWRSTVLQGRGLVIFWLNLEYFCKLLLSWGGTEHEGMPVTFISC